MRLAIVTALAVVLLSSCGDDSEDPNVDGNVDGKTQVFDVDTPRGTYQCISWKNGYGGGMDCDKIERK